MGSYSNMWWSVARRSWAVPLCRLQSLLSSNSKTTIRLAVPLCYISADPKRPVGRLWAFGIWGLGFRRPLN